MNPLFNPKFFVGNREKLKSLFTGQAPIVLTAHGLMQRNGDGEYKFRQDSSFWYLTWIDQPGVILVMDKAKEYLIIPEQDEIVNAFNGAFMPEQLERISGVKEIMGEKEGWKRLNHRIKKVRNVATLAPAPAFIERINLYTNPARSHLLKRLKEANPDLKLLDLRPHLARMRSIKQEVELTAIRTAIDITVDSLKPVARKIGSYKYEYEIEADITHGFRKRGALGHAYPPVVAGGKNTCTLHHFANNDSLVGARLLYFDVGAEYQHYSADITRTYFVNEPNKREQKIYQAVAEAHAYAQELLKPGVIICNYETEMEQFMGEKLRELGLIKLIEKETVRKYFPHATSHSLGLDVHDAFDYDRPLEPGMVLTVEPGIYVPEEGIGVRIEDDVLVTDAGIEVLSKKLPHFVLE